MKDRGRYRAFPVFSKLREYFVGCAKNARSAAPHLAVDEEGAPHFPIFLGLLDQKMRAVFGPIVFPSFHKV